MATHPRPHDDLPGAPVRREADAPAGETDEVGETADGLRALIDPDVS
ncbi:hypothetical protein ACFUIZ_05035 [Streptomyces cinereoruber]